MPARPLRVAMWSGPRNISTALMRSWGSRADATVCDEPLYAHYLTQIDARRHPGHEATLARHETDWRKVAAWLTGPLPEGKSIFYQKHMAHHLLPTVGRDWIGELANCLLIRNPRQMLASLAEFLPEPRLEDTGLPQQEALLRQLAAVGQSPPVFDAADVLADPPRMLRLMCEAVGAPFDDAMLAWAPGPRATDGAWGPWWYDKVYQTTGFAPATDAGRPAPPLPRGLEPLAEECDAIYRKLYNQRITL